LDRWGLFYAYEEYLGVKAKVNMLPLQPGDVEATFADIDELVRDADFRPATSVEQGIAAFIDWYKSYYAIK